MGLCAWLILTVFFHEVTGTMVKLNNGGFEDIVIAISPTELEDHKIVDNIKDMFKEASNYLFYATNQRFYFKTVKVVIPSTWTTKPEYKRVSKEFYEKADVIVADPSLKYGDEPYSLQYGGCGEMGRYIHFTSNFMTNDSLQDIYGSRGRAFVHEWAHFRWGVFDENNNDAPFYTTGINMAEATRCSTAITGQNIFRTNTGATRKCKFEYKAQLYEGGCQFIPDKKQTTSASIMYMPSLSSVIQFCDEKNHNTKAPNMQNKMCNFRSTWEVIMESADFASSSPRSVPPPSPTISLLQTRDRVLCLVLDVSESMVKYNRIDRLRLAAKLLLLQIIEMGSWVGIVTFNDEATIQTGLQQITSESVRIALTNYIPTKAGGGINVCAGIYAGFECEIVLLVAGEDSTLRTCFAEVAKSGSVVHTIALGPNAPIELEKLADMTGGLKFFATDSLDSNGLIDAFTGISSGAGTTISQQLIQLESEGRSVRRFDWLDGTVSIDRTVGNDTFFLVTWNVSMTPPGIILRDPKGKTYTQNNFVMENNNLRTARLKIAGTAEAGDWIYSIQNMHSAVQAISMTVTTRAASSTVPPATVKSYMNRDINMYPNPFIIYTEVSQGFLPVVGASVVATVEISSGQSIEVELFDDGRGADIMKNDGIYSRYITSLKESDGYNFKVRVQ
nr:PREDICTED: epithelial chloride channel protein-like [Anolis carolinensis]|eukprot:XP_003220164.2 PREDICTED: epithelial chloride channel protein-like [Anolis carolinensis]